jgi:hypothetical protein
LRKSLGLVKTEEAAPAPTPIDAVKAASARGRA